jgi:hypothetical protein
MTRSPGRLIVRTLGMPASRDFAAPDARASAVPADRDPGLPCGRRPEHSGRRGSRVPSVLVSELSRPRVHVTPASRRPEGAGARNPGATETRKPGFPDTRHAGREPAWGCRGLRAWARSSETKAGDQPPIRVGAIVREGVLSDARDPDVAETRKPGFPICEHRRRVSERRGRGAPLRKLGGRSLPDYSDRELADRHKTKGQDSQSDDRHCEDQTARSPRAAGCQAHG